ncbi:hypothetical protein P3T76_014866 [Phytophthora citrophthora]|uniref:Uncharacterized protein n=1 Tax=Phytophthora citrophthora TaxID=4793 RepID=A0AAD9LBW7_9STRA|nr:hypothetical protein P3T76_014866 [Phytophthora citrophthora]
MQPMDLVNAARKSPKSKRGTSRSPRLVSTFQIAWRRTDLFNLMDTQDRRSKSPPLPSARSLFQRSPDVSANCRRPLPRLNPLPPRSPTLGDGDNTLLVFVRVNGATTANLQPIRAISPRSVEVEPTGKTVDRKRHTRDFDDHRTSSDDGTEGETPRCRKRSNSTCKARKPTYLVRKV